MKSITTRAALACALLALGGCSGGEPQTAEARGERVYKNVCVACHAPDPKLEGILGPAIAGSSRELIEARVLHATYPEGYTPKRNSQVMPKLPHLATSIDDLTAFLNQ